jgi:hypothetical protein
MDQSRGPRDPRLHHNDRETLIERGLTEGESRRIGVKFVLLGEKTEIEDVMMAVRRDLHRAFANQD